MLLGETEAQRDRRGLYKVTGLVSDGAAEFF